MWYSLILDLLCVETVYRLLPFCVDLRTVLRTKNSTAEYKLRCSFIRSGCCFLVLFAR